MIDHNYMTVILLLISVAKSLFYCSNIIYNQLNKKVKSLISISEIPDLSFQHSR